MKNIMLFIVLHFFALHLCGQDCIHPKVEAMSHIIVLNEFKKIYEDYFWQAHQKSNKEAIDQNLSLIKEKEEQLVNMRA